jgi:putative ABC transport system permease protein
LIEEACPDCEEVGAEGYARDHIKYGSRRIRWASIEGQTPNVLETTSRELSMGRGLSWEDDRRRRNVAVIGYRIYEKLFVDGDPIGQRIKLGPHEFTVIGVIEEMGGMFGEDMDEYAIIPLSTKQKLYPRPGQPVNLIINAVSLERRERAMEQVRVALRSARRISYEQDDDFTIFTPDAILSFVNDFTQAFRAIMISLPLVSIVVGGIVIMNIMMISVTERTREIGIRKALGARRRHIMVQFLYESVFLSLTGGLIGIWLGVWLGELVLTSWMEIYYTPTALALILGFGISTGVGLFFGIYPAMKAARLDPIEALSFE